MRLFLADGVHAVHVSSDLVFLDTAADAYFCLGGVSDVIALGPGGEVDIDHDETAEQLLAAGLLSRRTFPGRRSPPPRPLASSRLQGTGRAPPLDVCASALAVTLAVARHFSRRSFAALLEDSPSGDALEGEPSAPLIEAAAQFEHLRPWLPLQGACLLRSYHLRAFLRARGFDAIWVFGVRTWPFSAHCWLQVGGTALDEDLERLAAYTPIMAA